MCTPIGELRFAVMEHEQGWNWMGAYARYLEGVFGLTGTERKKLWELALRVLYFSSKRKTTHHFKLLCSIKFYRKELGERDTGTGKSFLV